MVLEQPQEVAKTDSDESFVEDYRKHREERHKKEKMIEAKISSLSTLNDDSRDIEANFTMSNDDQKDASEPVEHNAGHFSIGVSMKLMHTISAFRFTYNFVSFFGQLIISAIDDEKA